MKYNRSRDGLVIALSLLQTGDRAGANKAFAMLRAGSEIKEIASELDKSSEKAYLATARAQRVGAPDRKLRAGRKALAALHRALASEDLEVDEEMAAEQPYFQGDEIPGAPDDTVEAGDDGDDDDGEFNFESDDDDEEEEEATANRQSTAAAARLDRANRNLAIAQALRNPKKAAKK